MKFELTGIKEVDDILRAVEDSANKHHNVKDWDVILGSCSLSCIDNIQEKADIAAKKIREVFDLISPGRGGVL